MSAKVTLHVKDADGTVVHLIGTVDSDVAVTLQKTLLEGVQKLLAARTGVKLSP